MALLTTTTLAWLAALTALSGCGGDGLVDLSYRGEPVFSIKGRVDDIAEKNPVEVGVELRVSMFWSPDGTLGAGLDKLVEQRSVAVDVTFPSTFRIDFFDGPDPAIHPGADWVAGIVGVYLDRNGDGVYTPGHTPSELVGGADLDVVLYVARDVPPDDSPTGRTLPAGFHVTPLPLPCQRSSFFGALPDPVACGVDIGAACAVDADCGASGFCLLDDGTEPYPGGYCTMQVPEDPTACQPSWEPVEIESFDFFAAEGDAPPQSMVFWLRPCEEDAHCRQGYYCDLLMEGCQPEVEVQLTIADNLEDLFFHEDLCGESFFELIEE